MPKHRTQRKKRKKRTRNKKGGFFDRFKKRERKYEYRSNRSAKTKTKKTKTKTKFSAMLNMLSEQYRQNLVSFSFKNYEINTIINLLIGHMIEHINEKMNVDTKKKYIEMLENSIIKNTHQFITKSDIDKISNSIVYIKTKRSDYNPFNTDQVPFALVNQLDLYVKKVSLILDNIKKQSIIVNSKIESESNELQLTQLQSEFAELITIPCPSILVKNDPDDKAFAELAKIYFDEPQKVSGNNRKTNKPTLANKSPSYYTPESKLTT